MPVLDLHHVAIKTADIDATVAFYNGVLGTHSIPRPDLGFPGAWLEMGSTQIHIYGGAPAKAKDGSHPRGSAAVDHVALLARDFDAMRARLEAHGLDYRVNDIPGAGLWQIFVHDPSGVLIELNFRTANEPTDAAGPEGLAIYQAGRF